MLSNHLTKDTIDDGEKYQSTVGKLLGSKKKLGQSPQNWARTVEIKISAKMSKIVILAKWLIFRNFDLRHKNGSHSLIFGPIYLISFAYDK